MSTPVVFERRRISPRDLPILPLDTPQNATHGIVEMILSTQAADVFYAIDPLPRYNVDVLLMGMRQSKGTIDVQLTTIVQLIKSAVNLRNPHAAQRDGMAENLIRQLELAPAFKVLVKQTLYDHGQLDDPTMAMLQHS
jgi:hypothetical protein